MAIAAQVTPHFGDLAPQRLTPLDNIYTCSCDSADFAFGLSRQLR